MSEWISVKNRLPQSAGIYPVLVNHPNSKKRSRYKLYLAEYKQTFSTRIWRWDLGNTHSYESINEWSERVFYWLDLPSFPAYAPQ